MTVVGARVDNRLLHGIVATQWAPQSGASRVMVINDDVANDPILKESMKLARPSGMAISIITEETALANFKAGKYDNQKVFVIAKTPEVFLNILEVPIAIPELILGGTVVSEKEDSIKASKRAYVEQEQIPTYKKILEKDTNILVKFVPSDKDIKLSSLL
ncbi:PTS sugar transporter subunit IIB [Enterococcus sp. HY326]|uniref:PTS sugar transporter subunit IIB n=1 Tax=Enterococcus sp. HY326 TaxID=2971265 RepID=UPI00223ECC35|nr:PTS sugar transporter subunit IIB [Enterococcus sp. HY326]